MYAHVYKKKNFKPLERMKLASKWSLLFRNFLMWQQQLTNNNNIPPLYKPHHDQPVCPQWSQPAQTSV